MLNAIDLLKFNFFILYILLKFTVNNTSHIIMVLYLSHKNKINNHIGTEPSL